MVQLKCPMFTLNGLLYPFGKGALVESVGVTGLPRQHLTKQTFGFHVVIIVRIAVTLLRPRPL